MLCMVGEQRLLSGSDCCRGCLKFTAHGAMEASHTTRHAARVAG